MKLRKSLKMRLLVIFVLSCIFCNVYMKDTYSSVLQNNNGTKQIITTTNSNQVNLKSKKRENYEIKVIGTVKNDYIEQVEENLELIPNEIMQSFINDGWKFYITTASINEEYFENKYDDVLGVTSYKEKCIKVSNSEKAINFAVIHEMGHYFDYITNFSSNSDEFKEIYKDEIDEFYLESGFVIQNEKEFFAQTFYYTIKDQSRCTPKALKYMKNQLNIFLKSGMFN